MRIMDNYSQRNLKLLRGAKKTLGEPKFTQIDNAPNARTETFLRELL